MGGVWLVMPALGSAPTWAEATGLARQFSDVLAELRQRRGGHDPGRIAVDVAVRLADGGEAISDLAMLRDQAALFGPVASDSTAWCLLASLTVVYSCTTPDVGSACRYGRQTRLWKAASATVGTPAPSSSSNTWKNVADLGGSLTAWPCR